MSEAANEELMLTGWRDGVCRAISAGGKHTQASLARWKELGLIGYRTDITDPEAHSRRLREAAQRRTAG